MSVKKLAVLAVALGVAEPSLLLLRRWNTSKGRLPGLLVALVVPWVIGAVLLVRGRVTAGAIVVGLLSLLDVVSSPGWKRTSPLDWTWQSTTAAAAAACLAMSVSLLVKRHRKQSIEAAT